MILTKGQEEGLKIAVERYKNKEKQLDFQEENSTIYLY